MLLQPAASSVNICVRFAPSIEEAAPPLPGGIQHVVHILYSLVKSLACKNILFTIEIGVKQHVYQNQ